MTSLDLGDLLLVASRTLDLDREAVLRLADVAAAEAVLAEARRCAEARGCPGRDPEGPAAVLLHGLVHRRVFGPRSAEVAVVAALQLLALNGRQVDDLGAPGPVRELLAGVAAGEVGPDRLAAWLGAVTDPSRLEGRMFDRFTDRLTGAVTLAQEEARLLGHSHVGTEDLLVGLLREPESVAAKALGVVGVSPEAVRDEIRALAGHGPGSPRGHVPFSPRAKKVLELAVREAKKLHHHYVGTEHLLLALLREGKGLAAQVLARLGADEDRLRRELFGLLGAGGDEAATLTRLVRMTVPEDLLDFDRRIADVRRRKEAAIDARDFATAAALRDSERQLRVARADQEREWTAGVDLAAVVAENHRLHGEVERLRSLLLRHGIAPDGEAPRTA